MDKPNFGSESLRIKLPIPFYYSGPRDEKEVLVSYAEVTGMTAPEITRFKDAWASSSIPQISLLSSMKVALDSCIKSFYDSSNNEVNSATEAVLAARSPFISAHKLYYFILLMTRGSSYLTTAYKCGECHQVTNFDLDPEMPIPDGIEEDRALMEDYMDFYSEVSARQEDIRLFDFTFKIPIIVAAIDENGRGTKEKYAIESATFRWPTLADYLATSKNPKMLKELEPHVLFDCISTINDLSEEETKALLRENKYDAVMRIKPHDWNRLLETSQQYGINMEHKATCIHCGAIIDDPFDMTNFFDFLKS